MPPIGFTIKTYKAMISRFAIITAASSAVGCARNQFSGQNLFICCSLEQRSPSGVQPAVASTTSSKSSARRWKHARDQLASARRPESRHGEAARAVCTRPLGGVRDRVRWSRGWTNSRVVDRPADSVRHPTCTGHECGRLPCILGKGTRSSVGAGPLSVPDLGRCVC